MQSRPASDPSDDFVADLVRLIARCTGGVEEQMALLIEEQIRAEYGGSEVYIPRSGWRDRDARDRAIRTEAQAGRSVRAIARKYCLGKSTIARILGGG